jgi:hypothetical protein
MPKVRPPIANLSDMRKVLHGINRLEERIIRMEGRMALTGSRVINDSAAPSAHKPWATPLRASNKGPS